MENIGQDDIIVPEGFFKEEQTPTEKKLEKKEHKP